MKPAMWTGWKIRLIDLAEVNDAWRLWPRAFVIFYLYELERITTWFMGLKAPMTEQASFTGAAWGFLVPILAFYMQTGRAWTK